MYLTDKAATGMNVADKLAEEFLHDETVSETIRSLRTSGMKLADIAAELRGKELVPAETSTGVLMSAVSSAARALLGDALADVIIEENRSLGRGPTGKRAFNVPVPEASAAGAKGRGFQTWDFEQDDLLKTTVAACTSRGTIDWEHVSWILERQHGIGSSAHGCRLRYCKITRPNRIETDASPQSNVERVIENGEEAVMSYNIEDYR